MNNFSLLIRRNFRYDRLVKNKIEPFIAQDVLELPKLPYGYDALKPVISEEIMQLHHLKHHKAYVDNYNATMKKYYDEKSPLHFERLVEAANFHGGGYLNHVVFWECIRAPKKDNAPTGEFRKLVERDFGSVDNLKGQLRRVCLAELDGPRGAGWGWLTVSPFDGKLRVQATEDQRIPQMQWETLPLVGIDVWEHAFELQYGSRADYVEAMFDVLNWDYAEKKFKEYSDKHEALKN